MNNNIKLTLGMMIFNILILPLIALHGLGFIVLISVAISIAVLALAFVLSIIIIFLTDSTKKGPSEFLKQDMKEHALRELGDPNSLFFCSSVTSGNYGGIKDDSDHPHRALSLEGKEDSGEKKQNREKKRRQKEVATRAAEALEDPEKRRELLGAQTSAEIEADEFEKNLNLTDTTWLKRFS